MNTLPALATTHFTPGKYIAVTLFALLMTFALFVAMEKLIANDEIVRVSSTPSPIIDLWLKIEDESIITKPKIQPKQKHIPKPLLIPKLTETKKQIDLHPGLYAGDFKGPVIKTGIKPSFGIDEGVARPIVRVEPKYPASAARDGLEGWVKLSFSISPSGTVDNIQVLDAEPKRVFNQAARRALAKWKYKPNIQAGKAQAQDGMMVMLDFKLAS